MGIGQIILTTGAMMLLGSLILTVNRSILENDAVVSNSEFGVAAISLATSIIEEAQGKSFDDAVVDSCVPSTSHLTPPTMLGPRPGEWYHPTDTTRTDFDDLNDFNDFSIEYVSDTTKPRIATFRGDSKGFRADYFVRSKVQYETAAGGSAELNVPTSSPTWHKKLTVTVTSPSSSDTLTVSTIISYWN